MLRRLMDIVAFIVLVAVPLAFWLTYTGPYQWIAEFQLEKTNQYSEKLTVALTALVWCGFCGLIWWMACTIAGAQSNVRLSQLNYYGVLGRLGRAALMVMPAAILAMSIYLDQQSHASLAHMRVAELVLTKEYASRYLQIDDAVVDSAKEYAVTSGPTSSRSTSYYVPLVPKNYVAGDPVYAYLESSHEHAASAGGSFTGLVAFTGLPGMARVALQRANMPPGRGYVLLREGMTPANYARMSDACMMIAGITGVIALFFILRDLWQWVRRPSRRVPVTVPSSRQFRPI